AQPAGSRARPGSASAAGVQPVADRRAEADGCAFDAPTKPPSTPASSPQRSFANRGSGAGDGSDLGAGSGRAHPLSVDQTGRELLRPGQCLARIRRPAKTWPSLQTTQSPLANGPDRGF